MNRQRRHNTLQRIICYPVILLMITFAGVPAAFAEDTAPANNTPTATEQTQPSSTDTTTTPTPSTDSTSTSSTPSTTQSTPQATSTDTSTSSSTPQQPTGADSSSYTYNEATGLWENDKYTWDPVTHQTTPKTAPTYSYNPSTGMWDTTEWVYDAGSGTYVPNVISAATPPAGAATTGAASGTTGSTEGSATPTTSAPSTFTSSSAPSSDSSPSANTVAASDTDPHSSGFFDKFYNAVISNTLSSKAFSGDALVSMNTLAGSALSGDASAIATILNLLQSTWSLGLNGSLLTTFTQNLFGDIVGDLWLNPQSGTSAANSTSSANDLTYNLSQNAAINNTITLEAASGDSTVSKNTQAGDATTGTATAIANIINAINSSIVSGSSFLGILNIYGSLNGDILLPPDLINTLLASNALGALDTSNISNSNVLGEFTNNLSTTNNVTTTATSGDASVVKNTSAGNATTGDAETNITVLNLTGRQVVGKDALLVFVNVLGKWVGMIVNAPTGATSAALGGGITENNTLAVQEQNNQAITNNIDVRATSGDALVTQNTRAGNATSGDAFAAANIVNMNASQLALTDWFGILFINVFGSWTGSFGIDTIAGTLPPAAQTAVQSGSTPGTPFIPRNVSPKAVRAFAFTPHKDGSYTLEPSDQGVAALADAQVLAAESNPDSSSPAKVPEAVQAVAAPLGNLPQRDWTVALLTTSLGLSLLGAERIATRRSRRH